MKKDTKIFIGIIIFITISLIFNFPEWAKENLYTVIITLLGAIIGGIWWIAEKLKEIQEQLNRKDKNQ